MVKSAEPAETTRCVRRPACRSRNSRSAPIAAPSTAARLRELTGDSLCLQLRDLLDPGRGEAEQLVERLPREGIALRGRLHLDEAAVPRHDDVHVGVGARVLGVVEVEERNPVDHPDRDRSNRVAERLRQPEPLERAHRRDVRAADRRAARAAVGLENVAVEPERPLPERLEVGNGADRAADQPLDLDRAALLLAARRLSLDALSGRCRQERVLGGDPTLALAAEPAGDVLFDHGRAEHLRPARRDHDRAVRVLEVVDLERDLAQLVRLAPSLSVHAAAPSRVATVTWSTSFTGSWRNRRPSSRNASGSPVVRKRYSPTRSEEFSAPFRASVSATSRAVSSAEKTSVTSRPKTRSKILRMSG